MAENLKLKTFKKENTKESIRKWSVYESKVNLPALLNNPRLSKRETDFFSKTWGADFEKSLISPSPIIPIITINHFQKFIEQISLKRKNLNTKLLQTDIAKSPLPSLHTAVPKIFFNSEFNLSENQTFNTVLSWSLLYNNKESPLLPPPPPSDSIQSTPDNILNHELFYNFRSSKLLQEKLTHYLDLVEVQISRQISSKSEAFFEAMVSHNALQGYLENVCKSIHHLREKLKVIRYSSVTQPLLLVHKQALRLKYASILEKLKLISTMQQTQPTIQLLLSTNDFYGSLDLIATTQEVLDQELTGLHCFRHLSSQLAEMEKLIVRMVEEEFSSFLANYFNQPIRLLLPDDQIRLLLLSDSDTFPFEDDQNSIDYDRLILSSLGIFKNHNENLVDLIQSEAQTTIRTHIKQTVIELISNLELEDSESKKLVVQMRMMDENQWLVLVLRLLANITLVICRIKTVFNLLLFIAWNLVDPVHQNKLKQNFRKKNENLNSDESQLQLQNFHSEASLFISDDNQDLIDSSGSLNLRAPNEDFKEPSLFLLSDSVHLNKSSTITDTSTFSNNKLVSDRSNNVSFKNLSNENLPFTISKSTEDLDCLNDYKFHEFLINHSSSSSYNNNINNQDSCNENKKNKFSYDSNNESVYNKNNNMSFDNKFNYKPRVDKCIEDVFAYSTTSTDTIGNINKENKNISNNNEEDQSFSVAEEEEEEDDDDDIYILKHDWHANVCDILKNCDFLFSLEEFTSLKKALKSTLRGVGDFAQQRISKILSSRDKDGSFERMTLESFIHIIKSVSWFSRKIGLLTKTKNNFLLKGYLQAKSSKLAGRFHEEKKNKLCLILDNERWNKADVPREFQEIVDQIHSSGLLTMPTKKTDSDFSNGKVSDFLDVSGEKFVVVGTALILLKLIVEYCDFSSLVPLAPLDVMNKLIELLKTFNSRTCQLVLGAGAVHLVGLKNINTKNLALASRCLQLIIHLLPLVKNHFQGCLPPPQSSALKQIDYLQKDYKDHVGEISVKLVNIMDSILITFINKYEFGSEHPSPVFISISKQTSRLYEAIGGIFPLAQIQSIIYQVQSNLIKNLKSHLISKCNFNPTDSTQLSCLDLDLNFYNKNLECLKPLQVPPISSKTLIN